MTEPHNPSDSVARWAADHFTPVPGYFNTATAGLPTRASLEAIRGRLDEWQAGELDSVSFDVDVDRSIDAYARLVGTTTSSVAIGTQVASIAGVVAASLPAGATVLCAEEDFTSVLFPFMADDRLTVRAVPLRSLVESIGDGVDLVAVSAVQSSDGYALDLDAFVAAAQAVGARTFLDTTQAAGWAIIDADRFDVTGCHGYKWLCSPRGAAFMTVNDSGSEWLRPRDAGWYAGENPWTSIYSPPLRLAESARRFNVSPAWFSFVGAMPTLELLADLGAEVIRDHSVGLANLFREHVGLAPSNSAIVSVSVTPEVQEQLKREGIVVAGRAGRVRFSFYVYNTASDVRRAASIVGPQT